MGYLLYRYFPDARGSGVPQTKAALFARGGVITLGTSRKILLHGSDFGKRHPPGTRRTFGAGRGGIASVLGRYLGLSAERVKALIPVGASAAIAAAFNTPLAAVVFSLEEITGDLHAPILGSVCWPPRPRGSFCDCSSGTILCFTCPQYQLANPWSRDLRHIRVAGGLVSVAFTKLLPENTEWFMRLPKKQSGSSPLLEACLLA